MKMGSVLERDGGVIDGRFLSGCGASENIFITKGDSFATGGFLPLCRLS